MPWETWTIQKGRRKETWRRWRTPPTRAEAGGDGWTPIAKTPSGYTPSLWIKSADLGAISTLVSDIQSREGQERHFAQATESKRPLIQEYGGQKCAEFDGTDDLLSYLSSDISSATQGTLFIVFRLNALEDSQMLFSSSDNDSSARYVYIYNFVSSLNPNIAIAQRNNDTADFISSRFPVNTDTIYCLVIRSDGSACAIRLNGQDSLLTISSGANNGDWLGDTDSRDNFVLGGAIRNFGGEIGYLAGAEFELILYDEYFGDNSADLVYVEDYLDGEYRYSDEVWATAVEALPIAIDSADVDSAGNIFAGVGDVIKKSEDSGESWEDIYTVPGTPTQISLVFIDSRDYIYVSPGDNASDEGLYRSIDGGENFSLVLAMAAGSMAWGMDEDSNGNLYVGEYSVGGSTLAETRIWKSTNGGADWTQKYNHVTSGTDHVHDLRVDPSTNWIYAVTGDTYHAILRSKNAGENWTEIWTDATEKMTRISFLNGYVYVGTDNSSGNKIYKFIDDSDSVALIEAYDPTGDAADIPFFITGEYNGHIFFGQWASGLNLIIVVYDGTSWIPVARSPTTRKGYKRASRHNHNGVFIISHDTDLPGLRLTMP